MTKEKLEEYLSNLNLNYYNEEELQKNIRFGEINCRLYRRMYWT